MTARRRPYPFLLQAILVLLAMGACVPWLVKKSRQCMESMYNAPVLWVPEDFEQRQTLQTFVNEFKVCDTILVSWEGCTIDDERVQRFADELLTKQRERALFGNDAFIAEVVTGYGAVRALAEAPLSYSRPQAIARLDGILVGPDRESTGAVISLTEAGARARGETIQMIRKAAKVTVGLEGDKLHMAGAIVDGDAVDSEALRSMGIFAFPSALISLLVCYYFLRSWPLTMAIFCVAAFGEGAMLWLLYASGITMNAVLATLAPLTFVLAISLGIHLANYYQNEVDADNLTNPAARALRNGWWPCAMCAISSCLGFDSLNVSDIEPVGQFGVYSALGVILTTVLLFVLAPGGMEVDLFFRRRRMKKRRRKPAETHVFERSNIWERLAGPLCRYSGTVTVLTLGAMVACGWGLNYVRTSVHVRDLLPEESSIIRDYRWLEERVGPLISAEVIVNFAHDCPYDPLERLAIVRRVQQEVDTAVGARKSLSAATFLPEIPAGKWLRRQAIRQQIEQQTPQFIAQHLIYEDAERQAWRISTRLPAMQDIDYGDFLTQVGQGLEPLLTPLAAKGVTTTYTGLMPLVYAAQGYLLRDMFYSFLAAFLSVAVAMMIVNVVSGIVTERRLGLKAPNAAAWCFRRAQELGIGLLAMVPNVLPAVIVFGAMGWLGFRVDIGTMMTASVAIGLAVDDAIHFLAWFGRELSSGHTPQESVRYAARHCGWAMFETTAICTIGMLVYVFSGFLPTQRFAWMIGALLMIAVTGNLVLLPPLLVGPLGRPLIARWGKGPRRSQPEPAPAPEASVS